MSTPPAKSRWLAVVGVVILAANAIAIAATSLSTMPRAEALGATVTHAVLGVAGVSVLVAAVVRRRRG